MQFTSWDLMTQEILDSIEYHAYRLLWHNLSRRSASFLHRTVFCTIPGATVIAGKPPCHFD